MEINTKSITILCFCLTDSAYMLTIGLDPQNENGAGEPLMTLHHQTLFLMPNKSTLNRHKNMNENNNMNELQYQMLFPMSNNYYTTAI